jgi:hypothetical protein
VEQTIVVETPFNSDSTLKLLLLFVHQFIMHMTFAKSKIVSCSIGPYPRPMPQGMIDPMPKVRVKFDNGEEKLLFEFFPDEISFEESEFIGLTEEFANRLKFEKDRSFIQS